MQERLRKKQFWLFKVKGTENPADLFTKHLSSQNMTKCMRFMGAEFCRGRPEVAPNVKEDEDLIMDDGLEYDVPNEEFRTEAGEDWSRGVGGDDDDYDDQAGEEE